MVAMPLNLVPPIAVIPEGERRRQRRVNAPRPADMIQCRCGSRTITEVRTGAFLINGKVTGGTKQWICSMCLLRGEHVPLL